MCTRMMPHDDPFAIRPANVFTRAPGSLPEELVERLLEARDLTLERIVSRGHRTPPGKWYDQDRDEWVLLVEGSAVLRIEGTPRVVTLGPGDHLLLPAHARHRVEWTPPDRDTVWVALHLRVSDDKA